MGKSSLLNMLPTMLGSGTTVVTVNFQGLSGAEHRSAPHRWVAEVVHRSVVDVPTPPQTPAWGPALDWLAALDIRLAAEDRRLLLAIDEVERVEDGIRAGWGTTDFLDFVRAAGDRLERMRLLLVSAYPLNRLGPHWTDRLISAAAREITYLDADDARNLMRHPAPDFPDIYPPGGIEQILAQTRGHPYLIQLVCDELCRMLNEPPARLHATVDDVERAFDAAITKAGGVLFSELWSQRTVEEHSCLHALARSTPIPDGVAGAVSALLQERFVERRDDRLGIAVPLFRRWVVEST